MRKKWVIAATLIFLGVIGFLFLLLMHNQKGCDYNDFHSVLSSHNKYQQYIVTGSRITMPVFASRPDPLGINKLIIWFKYSYLNSYVQTVSPQISPLDTIFFSSNGSDYMTIQITSKNDRIIEVEIIPHSGVAQDAVDIQSKLSKAFPNLPCKITGNKKLEFVRP